jgi:hypothetical protein
LAVSRGCGLGNFFGLVVSFLGGIFDFKPRAGGATLLI